MPTLFLIRVHNATVKWHQAQQASNQHPAHNDLWNLVCVCSVTWAIGVIPCQFGSLPCSKTFECKEHLTGKINEPITSQHLHSCHVRWREELENLKCSLELTFVLPVTMSYISYQKLLKYLFSLWILCFAALSSKKSTFWLIELPHLFSPFFSHV